MSRATSTLVMCSVADFGNTENNVYKESAPPSPFREQDPEVFVFNFCSAEKGTQVLFATDEWFAAASNIIRDDGPVFDPTAFCEEGKVMNGWETRRRREAGHDWCVIKLAKRSSRLNGIEIDTAHFTGNNVPRISIELVDLSCEQELNMVWSSLSRAPWSVCFMVVNKELVIILKNF